MQFNLSQAKKFLSNQDVYEYGHSFAKSLIDQKDSKLVKSTWLNGNAAWGFLGDPTIERDFPSYQNCYKTRLFVSEDSLFAEIVVRDGDLCTGEPIGPRCVFLFEILDISPEIDRVLRQTIDHLAAEQVRLHELNRLKKLHEKFRREIIFSCIL